MIKGGYKIIDFKDVPFVAGGATMIEGIYDTVEANYRKPLLLSGLNIDGIERNDVYATPKADGSNYVLSVYGYTITISDIDTVIVNKKTDGTTISTISISGDLSGSPEVSEDIIETFTDILYEHRVVILHYIYTGQEYYGLIVAWDDSELTIRDGHGRSFRIDGNSISVF